MKSTLAEALRSGLDHQFCNVRQQTESLCEPLSPEDMMVQSCPESSPAKWHLAHTTWFFETFVLSEFAPAYRPFDPDFRWLFNSYYNAVSQQPIKQLRGSFSRPSLEDILAYRASVDAAMMRLMRGEIPEQVERRITLGLHHEQQHQELLAYDIKNAFWSNPLHPAYRDGALPESIPAQPVQWIGHEGGLLEIGHSGDGFCFDNEQPQHKVYLKPFKLASRLVTCGEYLDFMRDGGYERAELWTRAGWRWLQEAQVHAPKHWDRDADGTWMTRSMDRIAPVAVDHPVIHVCYHEADAFARWAGKRLPTEYEWEVAASWDPAARIPRAYPWGDDEPTRAHANVDQLSFGTAPIGAYPCNVSPLGCYGMIGDAWEWTSSDFHGYPGFRAFPYAEYSETFFGTDYKVLRGGSWATRPGAIRNTFRNWDFPIRRQIFSGFRCARDA